MAFRSSIAAVMVLGLACPSLTVVAEDKKDTKKPPKEVDRSIKLGPGGAIKLTAPKSWKKVKPRNRIIKYEFAAPAAKGDKQTGRVTMMGAGGGIEANVARWMKQFRQPDSKTTKDRTKVTEKKVGANKVHLVDISGTYKDQPGGPFSGKPAVMRKDYRMLSAIIETPKYGHYFLKMYGPKKTIAANEKDFQELIKSLKVK